MYFPTDSCHLGTIERNTSPGQTESILRLGVIYNFLICIVEGLDMDYVVHRHSWLISKRTQPLLTPSTSFPHSPDTRLFPPSSLSSLFSSPSRCIPPRYL